MTQSSTEQLLTVLADCETPGWAYSEFVDAWLHDLGVEMLNNAVAELDDPSFTSRHGTRNTKNLGCQGPLCSKASRDYMREYRPPEYGKRWSRKYSKFDTLLLRIQALHNEAWDLNDAP